MFAALNAFQVGGGSAAAGQEAFTTAGTYSWTCPFGITSVSVVCVGGGGGGNSAFVSEGEYYYAGGGGGALAYANNISVTPGTNYAVIVGAGGAQGGTTAGRWK